jgi:hypothetical protein
MNIVKLICNFLMKKTWIQLHYLIYILIIKKIVVKKKHNLFEGLKRTFI